MTLITNKKIAELKPTWSPYSGFSLLFDHNNRHYQKTSSPSVSLLKYNISEAPDGLIFKLSKALEKLGPNQLLNQFLLCLLPIHSYHTTIWGGISQSNKNQLKSTLQNDFSRFEQALHGNLTSYINWAIDSPLVQAIRDSQLMQ